MIIVNPLYSHRINSVMSDQESVQNTDLHKQTETQNTLEHILETEGYMQEQSFLHSFK